MNSYERYDVLKNNLREFQARRDIASEQCALTLSEMVNEICKENLSAESTDIFRKYSDLAPLASATDKLLLCRRLLANEYKTDATNEINELIAIGDNEDISSDAHGKVAYPKNNFNDSAYERLSLSVDSADPIYTSSINSACEAVADGSCEFCIMPMENSLEGKLFGFYALIDRFELKISNTCEVQSEGESRIRYALVSRGCREPSNSIPPDTSYILEFFVLDSDAGFLGDLIPAADACGAELVSIDSRPVPYDTQSKKFIMSFRIRVGEALLFRAFLGLNYDSYSPIGLYPDIQN